MLLTAEKQECEKNQKIIVSRDKGSSCQHRAINDKCCDYLVLNDSAKSAYFIELKGSDIRTAVSQLEVTERRFRAELKGYAMFYRIIAKKMRTHELKSNTVRKFQDKYGAKLQYATEKMEERIQNHEFLKIFLNITKKLHFL